MSSERSKDAKKTVRFAANAAAPLSRATRPRDTINSTEEDGHDRRKKRPRLERPNEDEVDDVDDWEGEEEDDEGVPKPKDLLDAKRKRRERQHGEDIEDDDEEDDTHIDSRTSLLAEQKNAEITMEPFNMDAEQNDGSGYFDGDTYIFRKRAAEEEPDAWLESLSENREVASIPERMDVEEEGGTSMDDLSQEDLFAKIVPLVSDTESVLQAVARYGNLLKRHKKKMKDSGVMNDSAVETAQKALNDLTEAANALMLKGNVDIYQQTRADLMALLPDTKPKASINGEQQEKPVVSWEYCGNQDGEVHGPYSTQQMLSWIQAGYFVGTQAVQIRTIRKEFPKDKSTVDDLLSDLMDDEEEDKAAEAKVVKGEWQSSNDVDFASYG